MVPEYHSLDPVASQTTPSSLLNQNTVTETIIISDQLIDSSSIENNTNNTLTTMETQVETNNNVSDATTTSSSIRNHITTGDNTNEDRSSSIAAANDNEHEENESLLSQEHDDHDITENAIIRLTSRLRCLFTIITWPIVPLGTIVILSMFYFLYTAAFLDIAKECSHPMKGYAIVTVIIAAYAPYHTLIRDHAFHYRRERDGPNRPLIVRRYDQIIHTIALLYVYAGITLVETCREDITFLTNNKTITTSSSDTNTTTSYNNNSDDSQQQLLSNEESSNLKNTCQAKCPNLTASLTIYVATLEVFTLSLIIPLLFLPCIYLWFLRQATANQDALSELHDRFREEEESLLLSGGTSSINNIGGSIVTTEEILSQFQNVQLIKKEDQIWIVPIITTQQSNDVSSSLTLNNATNTEVIKDSDTASECCICMCDFQIISTEQDVTTIGDEDIETGICETIPLTTNTSIDNTDTNTKSDHNKTSTTTGTENKRDGVTSSSNDNEAIVRTILCGHLFHRRCISSWVSGRWQHHTPQQSRQSTTINNRVRARRMTCPLCRQDLRPTATTRQQQVTNLNQTDNNNNENNNTSTTRNNNNNNNNNNNENSIITTIPTYNTFV